MDNSWWVPKCTRSHSRTMRLRSTFLHSTADWSADKRCWWASLEVGFCFKSFLFSFNLWWSSSSCLSSSDSPTALRTACPSFVFNMVGDPSLSSHMITCPSSSSGGSWCVTSTWVLPSSTESVNGWQIMNGEVVQITRWRHGHHQHKSWKFVRGFNRMKNRGAVQNVCWRRWHLGYQCLSQDTWKQMWQEPPLKCPKCLLKA